MSAEKKDEPRIFKLWKCPVCGEHFNHWVQPEEAQKGYIECPHCYRDVTIKSKKNL